MLEEILRRAETMSEGHCFYDHVPGSKTLLVTFAYIDLPMNMRAHNHFLPLNRCSRLFLNSGRKDWYQHGVHGIASSLAELMEFFADLATTGPETTLAFLGHSMGAFPALACAIASSADRALVSVPEITLLQPGSISIEYLQQNELNMPSILSLLETNKATKIDAIIGTENSFDAEVARVMKMMPLVNVWPVHSGHNTFPYLKDQGVLADVLSRFADGRDVGEVLSRY